MVCLTILEMGHLSFTRNSQQFLLNLINPFGKQLLATLFKLGQILGLGTDYFFVSLFISILSYKVFNQIVIDVLSSTVIVTIFSDGCELIPFDLKDSKV